MDGANRILNPHLRSKVMSATEAALLIPSGANVGMAGFTGAGYPRNCRPRWPSASSTPTCTARNSRSAVWTGASTAPELDGALAMVDGIEMRLPYQSDPTCRKRINAGEMEYIDIHLSHVAQFVWGGFLGKLDVAVVEVAGILEDGRLIPSSSVGNNKTWLDQADKIILEVNSWQNPHLEGMHDIYYGTALPPHRKADPHRQGRRPHRRSVLHHRPEQGHRRHRDRQGRPQLRLPPARPELAAHCRPHPGVPAARGEDGPPAGQPAAAAIRRRQRRQCRDGRPAVRPFENLTAYTEVLQDGMLELIVRQADLRLGHLFSLSPDALVELNADLPRFQDSIILRPQEISNHPEVIRRLGVIAMNGLIEADIYGNVNSTHIMAPRS